jgi:hypothetical protein
MGVFSASPTCCSFHLLALCCTERWLSGTLD